VAVHAQGHRGRGVTEHTRNRRHALSISTTQGLEQTETPILDEPGGGVAGPSNVRGTLALAKAGPDTADRQGFINPGDPAFLDDPQRSDASPPPACCLGWGCWALRLAGAYEAKLARPSLANRFEQLRQIRYSGA
jgi:cyclophilin family peptidyl-prolyl cis-trans isomerase